VSQTPFRLDRFTERGASGTFVASYLRDPE
jgi:hypothetical protein